MTINDICNTLNLTVLCGKAHLNREVTGAYLSDLLSDVIGHAKEGHVWGTIQTHKNIIAVASLKEIAAIVLVNNLMPNQDTLDLAEQEDVIILKTPLHAFEFAGQLYALLTK